MLKLGRRAALAGTAGVALAGNARAQAWPSKPIRFIVPYPVGGIVDIVTRAVADSMQGELGQPIVVDPRPGGNSTLGTAMVTQSPADGYTMIMATISHVVAPHLQAVSYDVLKEFQGVALVAIATSVATVNAGIPVKTLAELVAYGRANPGKLNYLNPGNGSSIHLASELLKSHSKFQMTSVPYRGIPPGLPDLLEGRLQVGLIPGPLALPHVQSGKLRALALLGNERSKVLPDVPTFAEAGFGDAQVLSWYTIAVRSGTPPEIVNRINAAAMKAIANPDTRERLSKASCEIPAPQPPQAVQDIYARDYARYGKLVKDAGIKGDS